MGHLVDENGIKSYEDIYNWVCDCIDRQRLEMEEKVVLGIVVNKIIKLPTSPIHCESSTIKQRNPQNPPAP